MLGCFRSVSGLDFQLSHTASFPSYRHSCLRNLIERKVFWSCMLNYRWTNAVPHHLGWDLLTSVACVHPCSACLVNLSCVSFFWFMSLTVTIASRSWQVNSGNGSHFGCLGQKNTSHYRLSRFSVVNKEDPQQAPRNDRWWMEFDKLKFRFVLNMLVALPYRNSSASLGPHAVRKCSTNVGTPFCLFKIFHY